MIASSVRFMLGFRQLRTLSSIDRFVREVYAEVYAAPRTLSNVSDGRWVIPGDGLDRFARDVSAPGNFEGRERVAVRGDHGYGSTTPRVSIAPRANALLSLLTNLFPHIDISVSITS